MDSPFVVATNSPSPKPFLGAPSVLNVKPKPIPTQFATVGAKNQAEYDKIVAQSKALAAQSTTALSSDKTTDVANIKAKTDELSKSGVTTNVGPDGNPITTDASGKAYTPTVKITDSIAGDDGSITYTYSDGTTKNVASQKYNPVSNGGYIDGAYYPSGSQKPQNPDGTYSTPSSTDPTNDQIMANLNEQLAQSDALTASIISNIQSQYGRLIAQQEQTNTGAQSGLNTFLLKAGALQGTQSGQGALQSQISYGIQQVADLNSKEQAAITEAQQASFDRKYKLMGEINDQIEKIRKEKQTAAIKLNDMVLEANKKQAEDKLQASKDSAIINLYNSGVTDVPSILTQLKKSGREDVTASDISGTLKEVVPPGLDDLIKTMRANGAPQEVIGSVLASKNINDAYKNAGVYSSGGTGVIGEYNFYRAQAEAANQVPVDFNTYQNQDANRKIRVASAANAAGLTTAMTNTALKLSDDYEQRSKDFYTSRDAFNRVLASATDPSAAGDLALIFNFMKTLDPGSTVREGEFATAQNSGGVDDKVRSRYNSIVNGERLSANQRADFVSRATKIFNSAKTQQDSVASEFKKRATQYGVPEDLVIRDTTASGLGSEQIQNEANSQAKLTTYLQKNPKKVSEFQKFASILEKQLGRPATSEEFLQTYPEYQ